jgi:hypothetical protein
MKRLNTVNYSGIQVWERLMFSWFRYSAFASGYGNFGDVEHEFILGDHGL